MGVGFGPIENGLEHGSDRITAVRLIAKHYAEPYRKIFGEVPDASTLPISGSPLASDERRQTWDALATRQKAIVNRTFANIGNVIVAFDRTVTLDRSRFDNYADALATGGQTEGILSDAEITGLALFIGKAGCATCHNGLRFTDGAFHNTGIPQLNNLPLDTGRSKVVDIAKADPFNCLGRFSDAKKSDCLELRFVRNSHDMVREFRTPSLRNVVLCSPFMHAGQLQSLEEVIEHYASAPKAVEGHSELEPIILSKKEEAALVAFLISLNPENN